VWRVEFSILLCRIVYFISHNSDFEVNNITHGYERLEMFVNILCSIRCAHFSYLLIHLTKFVSNFLYYLIRHNSACIKSCNFVIDPAK
jgi:hypothetical protein